MVKISVRQQLYNLADDALEYQLHTRRAANNIIPLLCIHLGTSVNIIRRKIHLQDLNCLSVTLGSRETPPQTNHSPSFVYVIDLLVGKQTRLDHKVQVKIRAPPSCHVRRGFSRYP
jgi:hypothetical protein